MDVYLACLIYHNLYKLPIEFVFQYEVTPWRSSLPQGLKSRLKWQNSLSPSQVLLMHHLGDPSVSYCNAQCVQTSHKDWMQSGGSIGRDCVLTKVHPWWTHMGRVKKFTFDWNFHMVLAIDNFEGLTSLEDPKFTNFMQWEEFQKVIEPSRSNASIATWPEMS